MSKSILEIVQAIEPNARGTSRNVVRKQRQTIEEARTKIVEKLNDNIAFVSNGMKAANDETVDTVFTQDVNDKYQVGAKYGNRWLPNLVTAKQARFENITQANLVGVMSSIAEYVEAGNADDDIHAIRLANANRKRRNAAYCTDQGRGYVT